NDPVEIDFFITDDTSQFCDCKRIEIGDHFENYVPVAGPFSIDLSGDSISLPFDETFDTGPAWLCVQIDGANEYNDCNSENNFVCIPVELLFNIPPILDSIGNKEVDEGETLGFVVTSFDPDFDKLYMGVNFNNSCECIDVFFEDSGNGHAYFEWTPNFDQAGSHDFEFYVYDDYKSGDFEDITITVNDVNRDPVIDSLPDTLVYNEGELIQFRVSASDADDDCFELSMISPNLPPEAQFNYVFDCVDHGDFYWSPNSADSGTYHAVFAADDGNGGIDEDTVVIVIKNINAKPTFNEFSIPSGAEDSLLTFQISAFDIDGNLDSIFTGPLVVGAFFDYDGNGTGTFTWTPDCNQSGQHAFEVYAVDDSGLADTIYIILTISERCDQQLTVVTTPCVQCTPPQSYTDVLVSDDGFGIEFNNYLDEFSISENISIGSARDAALDYYYDAKTRSIVIFPEFGDFFPIDTISVSLTTGIFDLSETSLDKAYNFTYLTGPVVYPGDCNNDGTVNEVDVLSIGLYWTQAGPDREVGGDYGPLDFFAQPAHIREQGNGTWDPLNGIYADVDGNGIVDADDLCGIAINFAMTVEKEFAVSRQTPVIAAKTIGSKVLEEMRAALIECPDSGPKTMMLEAIESALRESEPILPREVTLNQNYPNPFNPSTTIEFALPKAEQVTLAVYNLLGQRVITLVDEKVEAGFKSVVWSGNDHSGQAVASGIYFYKLNTESKEIIKRMLLVK
ncbi:MAG: Ig-like domain-containing protein, partial [Candidatus Zixiibacteriota bacterium]